MPKVLSEEEAFCRLMTFVNVVDAVKRLLPEKVLLSPSTVELAAVIVSLVSPRVRVWLFSTIVECASPAFVSVPEMVGVNRRLFADATCL